MESRCDEFVPAPGTRCTFRLEGIDAACVAVVGTFNRWSTTRDLMTFIDGRWEAHVTLAPGRHSYCFFALEKAGGLRGTLVQIGSTIDVGLSESESAALGMDGSRRLPFEQIFTPCA